MELVAIFVSQTDEILGGLHAIRYDDEEFDEFERLFDLWNDYEFLHEFCLEHEKELFSFYGTGTLESIVEAIIDEAASLEDFMLNFSEKCFTDDNYKLQMIFKPLHNKETTVPVLQETKAKILDRDIRHPMLRFYALRIEENAFVITGGAIKVSKAMIQNKYTQAELEKLAKSKKFLTSIHVASIDDLNYYYEQD